MKKYLSIALIAVMGLLAWSCSDDNIVAVYNPEGVTPQTLDDVTGVTLTPDGAPVNFTFSQADFGINVPVVYTLYVAKAGTNFDPKQKFSISKVNVDEETQKLSFSIKQADLNTALLNLGAVADVDFPVEF